MNPLLKKRLIFVAKIVIVLLVTLWVIWELRKSWRVLGTVNALKEISLHFHAGFLTLSALFYILAYVPAALFWRYTMQSMGQSPKIYESLRAYFIGHLGKYVPGKGMVVVLRSGLLNHQRTRPSIAAAAVFLETLTMMAVGAFLSAAIIVLFFRDTPQGLLLSLLSLGVMVVAGLPVYPPLFRLLAKRLGVGRKDPQIDEKLAGLNGKTLAIGWVIMLGVWILLGVSLWASILGIGFDTGPLIPHLPRFTLAAALSLVLGFVSMIPGGLVVREFALAQVLTLYFVEILARQNPALSIEAVQALAVTIGIIVAGIQRLISLLAELGMAAVLAFRPRA